MLAPSYTNPASLGIPGIPPARVVADNEKVDRHMPPAADVTMLLVGHAHYDHLLDVPRVVDKHSPKAVVYGSETVKHILHAAKNSSGQRIFGAGAVVVPSQQQITDHRDPSRPGTWFYSDGKVITDGDVNGANSVGSIRVMPI
nr:hypothetical protein [Pseudomonas aeruginosa]